MGFWTEVTRSCFWTFHTGPLSQDEWDRYLAKLVAVANTGRPDQTAIFHFLRGSGTQPQATRSTHPAAAQAPTKPAACPRPCLRLRFGPDARRLNRGQLDGEKTIPGENFLYPQQGIGLAR